MAKVAIKRPGGDQVAELPDTWTPVIDASGGIDRALVDAWSIRTATMPETDARAAWLVRGRWFLLLFELWREDVIELAERLLRPASPLALIDIYPPSLRHHDNFQITREGLVHLRSGRVHYDFHYRVRRAARPPAATEPIVTPPLTREAAVRQIIAAEKVPGAPGYSEKDFVAEVRSLCKVSENARGFHRTTLRRLFNNLKNRTDWKRSTLIQNAHMLI